MSDSTEMVYVLTHYNAPFAAFRSRERAREWVESNAKQFDRYNAEHAAWVSRYTVAQSAWVQAHEGAWSCSDVRSELEKEYRGIRAKYDIKTLLDPGDVGVVELELRP